MIHEVTAQGATIEEALQNARDALHAPADADVHVELIAQPSKGLLGLFGKKKAEARAYYETPDAPVKKPQEKKQPKPQQKQAEQNAQSADKPQQAKKPQQKPQKKQPHCFDRSICSRLRKLALWANSSCRSLIIFREEERDGFF